MDIWCESIQRDDTFRTQIDPLYGGFTQTDASEQTPRALRHDRLQLAASWTPGGTESLWRNVGLAEQPQEVTSEFAGRPPRKLKILADEVVTLHEQTSLNSAYYNDLRLPAILSQPTYVLTGWRKRTS